MSQYRYEQVQMMLDAMDESWDDLLVEIAKLSDAVDGGDWSDADKETIVEEFDPWKAVDDARKIIDELVTAVLPLAKSWDTVKKSVPQSANLNNYYIWKPNIDGVDGISFSEIKRANELIEKMRGW